MERHASNRHDDDKLQQHQEQLNNPRNGSSSSSSNNRKNNHGNETNTTTTHAERGTIGSFQGGPTAGTNTTDGWTAAGSANGKPQQDSIDYTSDDGSSGGRGTLGRSFMRMGSVMGCPNTASVMFEEHLWDRRNFETMGSMDMKMKLRNISTANYNVDDDVDDSTHDQSSSSPRQQKRLEDDEEDTTMTEVEVDSSQTSFVCTIPPSAGSPWSASFAGTSGLMMVKGGGGGGGLGYAKTNVSLGYDILPGRTTLVCDWRAGGGIGSGGGHGDASLSSPKVSYSALIRSSTGGKSLTQITMHNPPSYRKAMPLSSSPYPINNTPALSVCNSRYWMSDKIHGTIEFGLLGSLLQQQQQQQQQYTRQHQNQQPDRRQQKNLNYMQLTSPLQFIRLGLATTNPDCTATDTKNSATNTSTSSLDNQRLTSSLPNIRINLDWGVDKLPLKLWYNNNNNYNNHQRGIECYLALGYVRRFDVMALVTQKLTPFTSLSVGMGHSSWLGLSWIFRLRSGTFSLNVPIHISSAPSTWSQSVIHHAVSAYVAFWTGMIHLALGDWIHGKIGGNGDDSQEGGEQGVTSSKESLEEDVLLPQLRKEKEMLLMQQQQNIRKARNDAESQTLLMKRKADANRKVEKEKNGLVIVESKYGVDGGDIMDATVQLQFWVMDSRLQLAATCKGNMLGFYNVEDACVRDEAVGGVAGVTSGLGLAALWKHLVRHDPRNEEKKMPYLAVRYQFDNRLYDVKIRDNEALMLPSPRSILVNSVL